MSADLGGVEIGTQMTKHVVGHQLVTIGSQPPGVWPEVFQNCVCQLPFGQFQAGDRSQLERLAFVAQRAVSRSKVLL